MPTAPGPLLSHLPAIYHSSEALRELLSVFEAILFGPDGSDLRQEHGRRTLSEVLPLAERIATIASLFDAYETPRELLPWLTQWVALSHLSGLTEERQRQLLAEIVPLYAVRGTQKYLEKLLSFFKPDTTVVVIEDEELHGFVVGTSKLGLDTRLERERPFWFRVRIQTAVSRSHPDELSELRAQWEDRVRQVIDLAKPAHTLYELDWLFAESEESH
jgi:phage tail-like protein